jgi:hypothetical protein
MPARSMQRTIRRPPSSTSLTGDALLDIKHHEVTEGGMGSQDHRAIVVVKKPGPPLHMLTAHALIHPSSLRMSSRQVNGRKGPRYGKLFRGTAVRPRSPPHSEGTNVPTIRIIPVAIPPRLLGPGHWGDSGGQRRAIQLKEKRPTSGCTMTRAVEGPEKKKVEHHCEGTRGTSIFSVRCWCSTAGGGSDPSYSVTTPPNLETIPSPA